MQISDRMCFICFYWGLKTQGGKKKSSNLSSRKLSDDVLIKFVLSFLISRHATQESANAYSNLSFEEVVQELVKQKEIVRKKDAHIREMEDYIDNLLVRVMEETPSILRTPYEPKKKAGKLGKK